MTFITNFLILIIIVQSTLVVTSKNPITSILQLVGVYFSTSILFLILGAEYISILLIIIYVGAVAILFIFVIMMLHLRVIETYNALVDYVPIGLYIGFCFLCELLYVIKINFPSFIFNIQFYINSFESAIWIEPDLINSYHVDKSNVEVFGTFLFNHFWRVIIISALILLLAGIGALALTIYKTYKREYILNTEVKPYITKINNANRIYYWKKNKKF